MTLQILCKLQTSWIKELLKSYQTPFQVCTWGLVWVHNYGLYFALFLGPLLEWILHASFDPVASKVTHQHHTRGRAWGRGYSLLRFMYISPIILTGEWLSPPTTGEAPPPLSSHTFTKIDHHRAVVFGGNSGTQRFNDAYVLDMETWVWKYMRTLQCQ